MTFQVPAILASDMAGAGAVVMAVVSATGGVSFGLQAATSMAHPTSAVMRIITP
ncbi:MAG TPA: hypothetical protein VIF83_00465 [Gemmatimonadaceae bacterium]